MHPIGEAPGPSSRGRVSRVARLLALAHRFEKLIRDGEMRDYADLARLGHVTLARLTQIMNLLNLAPDIQGTSFSCRRSLRATTPRFTSGSCVGYRRCWSGESNGGNGTSFILR